jgi:predicted ferric reductase
MSRHLAWYVSRATGIVSWGLIVATMLWGFCHATRVLGRRAHAWWMLGVHRFLGALTVVFVVVHVLALIADNYTTFALVDVAVPFASEWRALPVALGIVGLYLLLAVEITSVFQQHLPRPLWRHVHLASYGLFVAVTLHALTAGTDVADVLVGGVAVGIGTVAVLFGALAWVARSAPRDATSSGNRAPAVGVAPPDGR